MGANSSATPPPAQRRSALQRQLDKLPIWLRGIFYYLAFLGFILGLVPFGVLRLEAWLGWSISLPSALRVVGGVVGVVALGLYTAASVRLMSKGRGGYVEFDPPTQFVATGPFRWCRNPIAACVLLMLLGEAVALSSVGMLVLVAIAIPLAHVQVVALEEPLLRERFGQDYERYCAEVPRWIPRLRRPRAGA